MEFKILVVEDNDVQFKSYKQALEDDGLNQTYILLRASNKKDANGIIAKNEINGAIIDLGIPIESGSDADKTHGLSLLKELCHEKQFPIVVVSANATSLDRNEDYIPRHMKILNKRPTVYTDVFTYFESIKPLLHIAPLFAKTLKSIKEDIQTKFLDVWGNWEKNSTEFRHKEEQKQATELFLKRYVCNYLIEKWMADDTFKTVYYTEFYNHTPVKSEIYTGDIVRLEGELWIVMTAPCDLSNDKYPTNLTLLKCEEDKSTEKENLLNKWKSEKITPKDLEQVKRWFTAQPPSKHYLPPLSKGGKHLNVLFKEIKTMESSEENRNKLKEERVVSISYHILPYILQRYGAYVSRIGQAEVNIEDYIYCLLSKDISSSESSS